MSTPATAVTVVLGTLNGQTLTVVRDLYSEHVTLRVAKDGHNRAVAKLDAQTSLALSNLLAPLV